MVAYEKPGTSEVRGLGSSFLQWMSCFFCLLSMKVLGSFLP